jgi:hypothetical protein
VDTWPVVLSQVVAYLPETVSKPALVTLSGEGGPYERSCVYVILVVLGKVVVTVVTWQTEAGA